MHCILVLALVLSVKEIAPRIRLIGAQKMKRLVEILHALLALAMVCFYLACLLFGRRILEYNLFSKKKVRTGAGLELG